MKNGVLLFSLFFCSAFSAAQEGNSLHEWISGHTGNVLICGHRGGFEGALPENSLSRFKKTASRFKKSAVMLELDVRQSADGELYVLHDDTLERTTTGKGLIRNAHSAYLDSLYLKTQQGLPTQERLPRLEAILDWAAGRQNVFLMIDVKADVWEKTLWQIQSKRMEKKCLMLTFSIENTRKVFHIAPTVFISALVRSELDWSTLQSLHIPAENLVAYINDQTPATLLDSLKQHRVFVTTDASEHAKKHPYPFEQDDYLQLAREKKLDIFITDFPVHVGRIFQ